MNDLKIAIRQLFKHKGSSLLAALILALGVGGTTAVFSLADKTLLNPIPSRDADRMVMVREANITTGFRWHASPRLIHELTTHEDLFESTTYFGQGMEANVQIGEATEKLRGVRVRPNFFEYFGWNPTAGRAFLPTDGDNSSDDVVVISDGFWRRHFGGSKKALGAVLELDGKAHTIVGIMPPNGHPMFTPGISAFWIPLTFSDEESSRPWQPENDPIFRFVGRLQPGVEIQKVQVLLDTLSQRWMEKADRAGTRWRFEADPAIREFISPTLEKALWSLQTMIGLLLLIACANVGNLLFSRALTRRGEFGLRMAIGAGRFRLARQMLAESLLLSALAALSGLFIAWAGIVGLERSYLGLEHILASGLKQSSVLGLNWKALLVAGGVSTFSGLLFGMVPAFLAARIDVNQALKESARQHSGGLAQRLFHDGFVVAQISFAVVMLIGAGMMIHSVVNLLSLDIGMNAKGLYRISYNPNPVHKVGFDMEAAEQRGLSREEARREAYRRKGDLKMSWHETMLERLNAIPGIDMAAADDKPGGNSAYHVEGRSDLVVLGDAQISVRGGDYFQTVRAELTAGRWLTADDCNSGEQTVVINERMAQVCWPGQSPLGKRFRPIDNGRSTQTRLAPRIVVGVVQNIRHDLRGVDVEPGYYEPFERLTYEEMRGGFFNIGDYVIRSGMNAGALRKALTQVGLEMSPPVDEIWSFSSIESDFYKSTAPRRLLMWLLVILGGLGLLISALGVYAVMSCAVAQRIREIGVRMAMGAGRERVRVLFLKRGARLILNGLALGAVIAMTAAKHLERIWHGLSFYDPWAFGGVCLAIGLVAGIACWLPARRAAGVEPMEALRNE